MDMLYSKTFIARL